MGMEFEVGMQHADDQVKHCSATRACSIAFGAPATGVAALSLGIAPVRGGQANLGRLVPHVPCLLFTFPLQILRPLSRSLRHILLRSAAHVRFLQSKKREEREVWRDRNEKCYTGYSCHPLPNGHKEPGTYRFLVRFPAGFSRLGTCVVLPLLGAAEKAPPHRGLVASAEIFQPSALRRRFLFTLQGPHEASSQQSHQIEIPAPRQAGADRQVGGSYSRG